MPSIDLLGCIQLSSWPGQPCSEVVAFFISFHFIAVVLSEKLCFPVRAVEGDRAEAGQEKWDGSVLLRLLVYCSSRCLESGVLSPVPSLIPLCEALSEPHCV